jgi:hypothetical protein
VAFEDGPGDRWVAPQGEEFVGDGDDRKRMPIAVHLDGGSRQAARDGSGIEEDAPFLRAEGQELQSAQMGDLQRIGECSRVGGKGP